MRLATSGRPPAADDVAAALSGAVGLLGQRPAITGLVPDGPAGPGGRREQGYASLAGWVAKGANLLHAELGLGAGDRLALAGPPGWPLAAVTLSAWWLGVTIVPHAATVGWDGPGAGVVVTHAATRTGPAGDHAATRPGVPHLELGDALDGTVGAAGTLEQWADAVTPHGDRPPPAVHDGDLVALVTADGVAHTQQELLVVAGGPSQDDGVLGMLRRGDDDLLVAPDAARRLASLALRPLVTGAATVVVGADDPARDAIARAERIVRWFE